MSVILLPILIWIITVLLVSVLILFLQSDTAFKPGDSIVRGDL